MADKSIYDVQREQVKQRGIAAGQQQGEAIQRRFAAMGGGPGGAEVKVMQQSNDALNRQQDDAIAGVNAQEAQEKMQQAEAEKQRGFQSSEAATQRGFQQKNLDLDRAQHAQEFGFQKEMATKQFDADRRDQAFNIMLSGIQAGAPLDLAAWMQQKGYNR